MRLRINQVCSALGTLPSAHPRSTMPGARADIVVLLALVWGELTFSSSCFLMYATSSGSKSQGVWASCGHACAMSVYSTAQNPEIGAAAVF